MDKEIIWKLPKDLRDISGKDRVSIGRMDPLDKDAVEKAKNRVRDELSSAALKGSVKRSGAIGKAAASLQLPGFITPTIQREADEANEAEFRRLADESAGRQAKELRRQMLEGPSYRGPGREGALDVAELRRPELPEELDDIYQIPGREGKFRSTLSDKYLLEIGQQPVTFDSFEEARGAHQQAFAMLQSMEVGPPSDIPVKLDPRYITEEQKEGQKKDRAKDIQRKSMVGNLSAEDLVFYYDNAPLFSQLGLQVRVPKYFEDYAREQQRVEKTFAPEAIRGVSKEFADVIAGVNPQTGQRDMSPMLRKTDEELIGAASAVAKSMRFGEEVQEAAKEGVLDARKERQSSFREAAQKLPQIAELRGNEKEQAIEDYSRTLTRITIPTAITPGVRGDQQNRAQIEQRLRNAHIDGQPLPEEVIQRAMQDYAFLRSSGTLEATGMLGAPTGFWSSVWRNIGGSAGDATATPVGELISREFKGSFESAKQASDEWKERVEKRANNVDAQDSQWAKDVEVLYNAALGMHDMFKGMYALIDPSSDEQRIAQLTEAYRKYLIDNRGGRPLFGGEIQAIEREQNAEAVTAAIQGMKEAFKKIVDQPIESLKGDPFGVVANMILVSRLANATGVAGKFRPQIARFLAKADNLMTGIPQSVYVAKKIFGPLAARAQIILGGPSRVELIVDRASRQSAALGDEAKASLESLQEKVKGGKDFNEALKETINEASEQGGEFLSGVFLENQGLFSDAKNINEFLGGLTNKKAILNAVIDNDVNALTKELPDNVLEQAGLKGAFNPEQLAPTTKEGFESILVDSTILGKRIDDQLSQLKETGRDAERLALLEEVGRLRDQINKGDGLLTEPLLRPGFDLDVNSTGPVPKAFDQNPGINNQALLVAAVQESRGKPIRVTIDKADKTFFEGPLIGPKEIIEAIPLAYRTRLPIYQRKSQSRAPELVEEMIEQGNTSDLALYLKRAKNIKRGVEAQKSFERLEKYFEETTGISVNDLYGRTRLGGLTQNADTVMELVVRRSSRVPGAPEAIPGLYGIPRTRQYVDAQGRPLRPDVPSDEPFVAEPYLTERQAASTKASPEDRIALDKMEQERIAAVDELRKNGLDPGSVLADYDQAVKDAKGAFFNIPEDLARAKPRYGRFEINWDGRDLEKAIYIAGSKQNSARKTAYLKALTDKGFTVDQIETLRNEILEGLKERAAGKKEGMLDAPAIKVPDELIEAATPPSLKPDGADAIVRAIDGEPIFTTGQQEAIASQLTKRVTKTSTEDLSKAMDDRDALVRTAQDQIIAMRMKDEIKVGDDIANGAVDWDERTTPLIFTGTVDEVSAKMSGLGDRGSRYLRDMDLQPISDQARKALKLGDDVNYSVPWSLNEAFGLMSSLREMRSKLKNIGGIASAVQSVSQAIPYGVSVFKRMWTSRNPITFATNNVANMFLRTFVDGTAGPGIGKALADIQKWNKRKGSVDPQTAAIMDAAQEAGILNKNVVLDDLNPAGMKMPSEFFEDFMDHMSGKVSPRFRKALSTVSGVRLYNRLLNGLEKAYGASDPIFKIDHMYTRVKEAIDDFDVVEAGEFINFNTDKNLWQRVYRNKDGTFRLGSIGGDVLSESDMIKLAAKDAAQSANRLYFDYSDVPRALDLLRSSGLDAILLNPFVTWSWKALYLPMLKDGLAKEIMRGGENT